MTNEQLSVKISADIKSLKDELKNAGLELKKFNDSVKNTDDKAANSFSNLTSSVKGLIGAYVSLQAAQQLLVNSFNTSLKLDAINSSFEAIFGSSQEGQKQFDRLKVKAEELGLSIISLSNAYKLFAGATTASGMSITETNRIFDSVAKTASVLKLSSEDAEGALRALAQMMGKGTVQAEELRGQLGERIPGAFKLAANAMGVTEKELGKMLENGQVLAVDLLPKLANEFDKAFGDKVKGKVSGLSAEWERFKNKFTIGVEATNIGAFFEKILKGFNDLTSSKFWQDPFTFRAEKSLENLQNAINKTNKQDGLNKLIIDFRNIQQTLQQGSPLWNSYTQAIIEAGNKIQELNTKTKQIKVVDPNKILSAKMDFAPNIETQLQTSLSIDLSPLNEATKDITDFQAQTNLLTGNFKEIEQIGGQAFTAIQLPLTQTNELTKEQIANIENMVQLLGGALTSAFDAALINGQNFAQVLIKAIGDLIKRLIAAVATAAILTAILNTFTAGGAAAVGGFSGILKGLTGFNFGGASASGNRIANVNVGSPNFGNTEFVVRGNNLVAVLNSTSQKNSRTR